MNKKVVILTSGGLDSIIAYYYAKIERGLSDEDILPLWVDLGHPYNKKEENVIDCMPFEITKMRLDLIRSEFDNIPGKGDGQQIIPGRNLILASIASSFGEEIWLMALDGERHIYAKERDKSERFFKDATELLTYVFNISRPETRLVTPFENMTKTEILAWAIKNEVPKYVIKLTSTCYDDKYKSCGDCPACFKRWVAFTNNGLEEQHEMHPASRLYEEGSWLNWYIKKLEKAREQNDYSHYSKKRVDETLQAIEIAKEKGWV